MDTINNDNYTVSSENMSHLSSVSTPPNRPSSNSLIDHTPRRSARLSSKSPQIPSRTSNPLNIHRTMSGGVASSHSPKLNNRKRSSFSGARGGYSNLHSQTTVNDDISIHHGNNYTTNFHSTLPSDQSDDEEIISNSNTTVKSKPTGLASRSKVLSYFEQHPDGYKCKMCQKVYRATKLSDSNLRKHLSSSFHKVPNMLFKSQINDIQKTNTTISTISTERKRDLHSAAINCIFQDGLPFNNFRQPGMIQFLAAAIPGYKGPHRKTVRSRIADLYSQYKTKLRSLIPKLDGLALTSDLWKNSRRVHFISLTANLFNKNYETIPIVLGFRRVIGPHLATSIERYIKYELNRLGIQKTQIISITTDNGSNMKKATSTLKFGDQISCMAHNLNTVVKKGLCLWIEPKPDGIQFQSNLDLNDWEDLDKDEDDNNDSDEPDEDADDAASDLLAEEEDNSSSNEDVSNVNEVNSDESDSDLDVDRQFSSLILTDTHSSPIDHLQLLNDVFGLMKKVRIAIKFVRNHTVTDEYVKSIVMTINRNKQIDEKKIGNLVLDMLIRWNSSFLLLDRLLDHKDILNSMFAYPNNIRGLTEKQKKRLQELTINQYEWELLAILKNILEPFLNATVALSGETYPTMAISFYVYHGLLHFLQSTVNDEPITIALKQSLRFWFNIHFKNKLPQGQLDLMLVAAFLDPLVYNVMDDDDRRSAKKLIFRKLNSTSINRTTLSSLPTPQATTTTSKLNPLAKLAAACGLTLPSSTTIRTVMTLDEEISAYIKLVKGVDNFQRFWIENDKQLPRLAKLVRRVNVIPSTSISSEALFQGGKCCIIASNYGKRCWDDTLILR